MIGSVLWANHSLLTVLWAALCVVGYIMAGSIVYSLLQLYTRETDIFECCVNVTLHNLFSQFKVLCYNNCVD